MKIKAKKSLGQNFLTSQKALNAIIEASKLSPEDIVLEVGPGNGVLTEKICARAKKVIAVEKDNRLIPLLEEKFAKEIAEGKLSLVNADILETNLNSLGLSPHTFKVIANIPYYITGQFFRLFVSGDVQPSLITVLVQKEVAKRIVARDGKESILSLSIKAYGTPRFIEKVEAKYFSPKPKVDSAILLIEGLSKKNFSSQKSEEFFFTLIKKAFGQKRKKLSNNLKEILSNEEIARAFSLRGIKEKARAEDLPLKTWLALSEILKSD